MDEKAKELRREYKRQWYKNNKDKVRASQKRYWEKKAAELEAQEAAKAKKKQPKKTENEAKTI